jgi:lipopolysaccharide transport protein LptA
MMLLWMLYVVAVSLLLSGAALAAERIALSRRALTRWHWVLSIAASALVPAIVASVWMHAPHIRSFFGPPVSLQLDSLRRVTSSGLASSAWAVSGGTKNLSALPRLNTLAPWVWAAASCTLIVGLLVSGAHLRRRKRRWERSKIAGVSVYITDDVGPAIVGLLRPRIAVPRWLIQASAQTQALVIAHEQSHLEAHDVRIFTGALALLVAMPWNLPLWWQLRRLRLAIEVDCDARVLKSGRDVRVYGEALIMVGQRQSGYVGAIAGMSESRTFLEKRVGIMLRKPVRKWRLSTVALGCSSLALVATAAQIEPPNGATGVVVTGQDGEGVKGDIWGKMREITTDASSMDADNLTHAIHYKDLTLTQGNITVKADRAVATRLDFRGSRWTFDGNVRINAEGQGTLHSDEAVLEFGDNKLNRATATGSPAEFDQKRSDSDVVTHGHADEIVYEAGPGTVRLSNAYVTDGRNEIQGPVFVYSLRKEGEGATK